MRHRPGILYARVTAGGEIVMPTDPGYHRMRMKAPNDGGEPFAEDDPQLPKIEAAATLAIMRPWRRLGDQTIETLGLSARHRPSEGFQFRADLMLPELEQLEADFVRDAANPQEAAFGRQVFRAWLRGATNAAAEIGSDVLADEVRRRVQDQLAERGLELVRKGATMRYGEPILERLKEGAWNGENPNDVARALRRQFGAANSHWERLARSEITQAQALGKEAQYAEEGIVEYDYVTAGDSLVSDICRRHKRNNPHPVGAGPVPMRDSHPNCRCTIRPRVPAD